jgi:hypothetical protein
MHNAHSGLFVLLVVSVTLRPRFVRLNGPTIPFGQEAGWSSEPVWTRG